jgi:hypothetical protein
MMSADFEWSVRMARYEASKDTRNKAVGRETVNV